VPIGAHFTQTNPDNALLANPSSILNYSQGRIVGLRNTYAFPRAATDAVIEMVTDPKFDAREIGTKYVSKLERKLLKGFDGGDISEYDMRIEMDGNQDVRLFLRCVRYVVGCIFGDEAFADSMVFTFHPTFDDKGQRTFGSFMGSVWCQVYARRIRSNQVLLAFAIFIDKSYTRVDVPVKPAFCECCALAIFTCQNLELFNAVTLLNVHESIRFKAGGVRYLGCFPVYDYDAAIGSDFMSSTPSLGASAGPWSATTKRQWGGVPADSRGQNCSLRTPPWRRRRIFRAPCQRRVCRVPRGVCRAPTAGRGAASGPDGGGPCAGAGRR